MSPIVVDLASFIVFTRCGKSVARIGLIHVFEIKISIVTGIRIVQAAESFSSGPS